MQLNSCRLFVPVGGEQRDPDAGLRERCLERGSSAWGLVERKEMPHLGAVFVRLTNAAFFAPINCSCRMLWAELRPAAPAPSSSQRAANSHPTAGR